MNSTAIVQSSGTTIGCASYPCSTVAYAAQNSSGNYQPINVTIQPDTQWVTNNVLPFGLFGIEIAIAIGILAAAKCALSYFVIPQKKGK